LYKEMIHTKSSRAIEQVNSLVVITSSELWSDSLCVAATY